MSETPNRNPRPWFEDDDHALHTGFLIGILVKAGIKVNPVKDDLGNYKPLLEIVIPDEADRIVEPVRIVIKVLPGGN